MKKKKEGKNEVEELKSPFCISSLTTHTNGFYPVYRRKHKEAFVPPKPKLFDSTTLTPPIPPPPLPRPCDCATSGTRLQCSSPAIAVLSGCVRFKVGGRMFYHYRVSCGYIWVWCKKEWVILDMGG